MGRYCHVRKNATSAGTTDSNGQTMNMLAVEATSDWKTTVDHTFNFSNTDEVSAVGVTVGTNQITIDTAGDYVVQMDWSVYWNRSGVGWGQIIVNGTVAHAAYEDEAATSGSYWGGSMFAVLTLAKDDVLTFGYNRNVVGADDSCYVQGLSIQVRQLGGDYYGFSRFAADVNSSIYTWNTSNSQDWDAFNTNLALQATGVLDQNVSNGTVLAYDDVTTDSITITTAGRYMVTICMSAKCQTSQGYVYPQVVLYNSSGGANSVVDVTHSNAESTNGLRKAGIVRAIVDVPGTTYGIRLGMGSDNDNFHIHGYAMMVQKLEDETTTWNGAIFDSQPDFWARMDDSSASFAAEFYQKLTGSYVSAPTMEAAGVLNNGTSVDFDGVADYLDLLTGMSNNALVSTTITIEGWINADDPTSTQTIFHVGDNYPGSQWGWVVFVDSSGYLNFRTYDAGFQNATCTTALSANTDYHFAIKCDITGGTVRFYLDGAFVNEVAIAWAALANHSTKGVVIGCRNDGIGVGGSAVTFFNGQIDDIVVWKSLLDDAVITAHYNAGA